MSEEQYLLLDFHPLVGLKLLKEPPRVGLEETKMHPTYQAAMAFLMARGKSLRWESKLREVFSTESFVAQSSNYLVYIPRRGETIIDAQWMVTNQGKPNLEFDVPGNVFFASSAFQPQVLAKTEKNELFLPMSQGTSNLRIQYDPKIKMPGFFGIWKTNLLKPPTLLPKAQVEIRMASRHNILAANLLGKIQFPWFSGSRLLWPLLISFFWAFTLIGLLPFSKKLTYISSFSLLLLSIIWPNASGIAFWLIVFFWVVSYRKQIQKYCWEKFLSLKKITWLKWAALSVGFVLILVFLFNGPSSYKGSLSYRKSTVSSPMQKQLGFDSLSKKEIQPEMSEEVDETEVSEDSSPSQATMESSYLGVPIERPIPSEGVVLHFSESSIDMKSPLPLRLFVVSKIFGCLFSILFLVIWLFPIFRYPSVIRKMFQKA